MNKWQAWITHYNIIKNPSAIYRFDMGRIMDSCRPSVHRCCVTKFHEIISQPWNWWKYMLPFDFDHFHFYRLWDFVKYTFFTSVTVTQVCVKTFRVIKVWCLLILKISHYAIHSNGTLLMKKISIFPHFVK